MTSSIGIWKVPECAICYAPLASGLCVLNTCGHVFHHDCAITWLEAKRSKCPCPLCRVCWTARSLKPLRYTIESSTESSETLSANESGTPSSGAGGVALKALQTSLDMARSEIKEMRDSYCQLAEELDTLKIREGELRDQLTKANEAVEKYKTQRNEMHQEAANTRRELRQLQQHYDKTKEKLTLVKYFDKPDCHDEDFNDVLSLFNDATDKAMFLIGMHNRLREERGILRCVEMSKERWRENATELKAANMVLSGQLSIEKETNGKLLSQLARLERTQFKTTNQPCSASSSSSANVDDFISPPVKKRLRQAYSPIRRRSRAACGYPSTIQPRQSQSIESDPDDTKQPSFHTKTLPSSPNTTTRGISPVKSLLLLTAQDNFGSGKSEVASSLEPSSTCITASARSESTSYSHISPNIERSGLQGFAPLEDAPHIIPNESSSNHHEKVHFGSTSSASVPAQHVKESSPATNVRSPSDVFSLLAPLDSPQCDACESVNSILDPSNDTPKPPLTPRLNKMPQNIEDSPIVNQRRESPDNHICKPLLTKQLNSVPVTPIRSFHIPSSAQYNDEELSQLRSNTPEEDRASCSNTAQHSESPTMTQSLMDRLAARGTKRTALDDMLNGQIRRHLGIAPVLSPSVPVKRHRTSPTINGNASLPSLKKWLGVTSSRPSDENRLPPSSTTSWGSSRSRRPATYKAKKPGELSKFFQLK